ncbi:ATP-binding protein [Corallococcus macrosporus]|uniref:histidine kinase n=1 Tax=Corallococcus macrosporus DSM 14697 TaxID=1189310 RepID=A0A250K526_9BACT|nr:ATP-binding protein [Corallococcus macrosporus]ATB50721.1 cyclic nucleotide-binding protein [Corallococcus macrosporus DSM 14697]
MGSEDIVAALRHVPLFARLTGEQLRWMADHGRQLHFPAGTRIAEQGAAADGLSVILEGRTQWSRRTGAESTPTFTLEAGDLFGELILFLNAPYPHSGDALTDVRLFRVEPATFWELLRLAPGLSRGLMELASQRSQQQQAQDVRPLGDLLPAGRLAAELSAELGSPAAAARRSSARLSELMAAVSARAMALGEHGLSLPQRGVLLALPREAAERGRTSPPLEPLARAEREEALGSWLEARGVRDAWDAAPALVASGLDVAWLESVATRVGAALLGDVLAWLVLAVSCDVLMAEVERGTTRVSALAEGVKAYAFMDPVPREDVDLHEGLENALGVLGHRLRGEHLTVEREFDPSLPRLKAEGAALDELWTQLVLNALEALGERGGRVRLRTWQEAAHVVVEVSDDGPGIPKELLPRVFEPFFSTKPHAAGLGLDVCRRIVERHGGELCVRAEQGGTRIQVRLPV